MTSVSKFALTLCFLPGIALAEQPSLAVLPLQVGGGLSEGDGAVIADHLAGLLAKRGKFKVLDRAHMAEIMAEKQLQMATASDEEFIDLAAFAHAQFLVVGSLGRLGESRLLNVRMLDVNNAKTVHSEQLSWGRHDASDALLGVLAARLSGERKASLEVGAGFQQAVERRLSQQVCAARQAMRGRVLSAVAGEITVSLGSAHGLGEGSTVELLKGQQVLGQIELYEVAQAQSKGSYHAGGDGLSAPSQGQAVRPGALRLAMTAVEGAEGSPYRPKRAGKILLAQLKAGLAGCQLAKKRALSAYGKMSDGKRKRLAQKVDALVAPRLLVHQGRWQADLRIFSTAEGGLLAQFYVPLR